MADISAQKEKKSVKKKLQNALIALAIIAVAVGSVIYGIVYVMQNEGTVEIEAQHVQSLTETPKDEQGIIDYLSALYAKISDPVSAKVEVNSKINIPTDSISLASDTNGLLNDLKFAKDNITKKISEKYYPEFKGVYGESFDGQLPTCDFKAADTDYAVCTEGADETALKDFGKTASEDKNPENYNYVYISFPVHTLEQFEEGILNATFGLDEAQRVLDAIESDVSEAFDIVSENIECTDFSIAARADRFTDVIDYAIYTRNYTVTLDVVFKGEFASYGSQTISFEYNAIKRYDFKYAGIKITNSVVYVERGDEIEIPNTLGAEEDAIETMPMTWSSSDEKIASVTNNGYVMGLEASAQPVTVTATVEYLGRTYTSQCLVYVINSVENIRVSQKELTMAIGDNSTLTYTFEPDNATITDVLWFSDNEAVATVDEKGVITAISAGTANVYVVSVDNNFKSTCVVTVE